jgi:hypothetical protein
MKVMAVIINLTHHHRIEGGEQEEEQEVKHKPGPGATEDEGELELKVEVVAVRQAAQPVPAQPDPADVWVPADGTVPDWLPDFLGVDPGKPAIDTDGFNIRELFYL